MPRASHVALALLCAPLLAGCGLPRALGIAPYKIEIQQGNFISQEMTSQLKEGMSKEQVRQIMGTPLLVDLFHTERWDYIYTRSTADGRREKRRMAIFFEDGKLARVDGDSMPPLPTSAAGR